MIQTKNLGLCSQVFFYFQFGAPLKTVLFRDGGVSRVLTSSCIRPYTPVFRAPLPCPHKKCLVFRGALWSLNSCFGFRYSSFGFVQRISAQNLTIGQSGEAGHFPLLKKLECGTATGRNKRHAVGFPRTVNS